MPSVIEVPNPFGEFQEGSNKENSRGRPSHRQKRAFRNLVAGALLRLFVLGYGLSHQAHAQQIVVSQPDCIIFFHLTTVGQTSPTSPNAGFNNLTTGCTTWNVSYANTGFSALSLVFQSAPNVSGVAGTWVTFANQNLLAGVNPNTNTTGAFTWLTGYGPWVRMILASATGTGEIDGAAYGYRIPSAGTVSGSTTPVTGTVTANQGTGGSSAWKVDGSGVTQPVSGTTTANQGAAGSQKWLVDGSGVTQPVSAVSLPLPSGASTAAKQPAIGTAGTAATDVLTIQGITSMAPLAVTPSALPANQSVNVNQIGGASASGCPNTVAVSVTGGTTAQIVAASGATTIKICSVALTISLAGTAQFVSGTGSNCGSGTANLTGAMALAAGIPLSLAAPIGGTLLSAGASNALCITAAVGNVIGFIGYQQN